MHRRTLYHQKQTVNSSRKTVGVRDSTLVSVVIPCFNQGLLLGEAIESVVKQTHTNWECIVVNDGSTDATEEIASKYASQEKRIRCISKSNGGLSSARNVGLAEARGAYIQFLDADDLISPSKLELQISALANSPGRSLCISDYKFGYGPGAARRLVRGTFDTPRFLTTNYLEELIDRWEEQLSVAIHAFLFKAELFERPVLRFDENLPNHEDWDCWLRMFNEGVQIVAIHEVLATYRISEVSMSTDPRKMWSGLKLVCSKHLRLLRDNAALTVALRAKKARMRGVYRSQIWNSFLKRQHPSFVRFYRNNAPYPLQRFLNNER